MPAMPCWFYGCILIYFDLFLQENSGRNMEKKISINENAPAIADQNFEQVKLDLADFSSPIFPLKNSFTDSINNKLQNGIRAALLCNSRDFWKHYCSRNFRVVGERSEISDLGIIEDFPFVYWIMHEEQSFHYCGSSFEGRNSSNVKGCWRPRTEKWMQ